MICNVTVTKIFKKNLQKINKSDQIFILAWIKKNLINTTNPKEKDKYLTGNLKDLYHYRIGNYRLVVSIQDKEFLIILIDIGHRKDIYKTK